MRELLERHRLGREIIATILCNALVNCMRAGFAQLWAEDHGLTRAEVLKACATAQSPAVCWRFPAIAPRRASAAGSPPTSAHVKFSLERLAELQTTEVKEFTTLAVAVREIRKLRRL